MHAWVALASSTHLNCQHHTIPPQRISLILQQSTSYPSSLFIVLFIFLHHLYVYFDLCNYTLLTLKWKDAYRHLAVVSLMLFWHCILCHSISPSVTPPAVLPITVLCIVEIRYQLHFSKCIYGQPKLDAIPYESCTYYGLLLSKNGLRINLRASNFLWEHALVLHEYAWSLRNIFERKTAARRDGAFGELPPTFE